MAPTIEVKDEVEGEHVEASDFFYDCIGEPVPVRPTGGGGGGGGPELYDPGCLPSQPLAVSERFRLVFVAHSSVELILCREDRGCGGGREGDEGEGEPIFRAGTQRRGRTSGAVGLLWLSPDSSTLAASVGGTVNFFSVDSLLNKEQLPFFSCSIDEESSVMDMKWLKKRQNSYILLTSHGNLYLGSIDGPLKSLMDNVDAGYFRKQVVNLTWVETCQQDLLFRSGFSQVGSSRLHRSRVLSTYLRWHGGELSFASDQDKRWLLLRQYCSPFVMFSLELWMILFLQDVGRICSSAIWNNASLQLQITEKMRTSTLFCSVGHLVRRGMKQYLLILIEITGFQELSFKKMVTTIQSWGFALTKYPCMRKSKFNLELRNKRTFRHFASFFVFLEGKMFNVACVAEQTDFPRTGWPSDVEEDISGVEAQEEVLRFGRDDFTTGFYRSSNSGHRHNGTQLTKRLRDCC